MSETQSADGKSETQSAQDELDAETQSAGAETQSVDGCKSMTGVTLVRFDGTVVPWGDRDDDDDEDLWRMGSPPPPDDESETESVDDAQSRSDVERQPMDGYEMRGYSYDDATRDALALYYVPANSNGLTARLDDMATDRRYEMTVTGQAPAKHSARRGTRCSARGGATKTRSGVQHVRVHSWSAAKCFVKL